MYSDLTENHALDISLDQRIEESEKRYKDAIKSVGLSGCVGARYEDYITKYSFLQYADLFEKLDKLSGRLIQQQ